ncbi:MAG: outer membrane lipoprotein-sorting protein [bacterium]
MTTTADRRVKAVMTITDKSGRVQKRVLRLVMKGEKKLLVSFIEPVDLRGVSFLTTSPENMWVYLPAHGRVRRISGSAADQSFGGSDFSYRELASISFASSITRGEAAEVELNGIKAYLLNLDDDGTKSRLWVELERFVPLEVDKLGKDGTVRKRIVFSDFKQEGGIWIPCSVRLENLSEGSITELKLLEVELNIGIKDGYFTEENMKKGG